MPRSASARQASLDRADVHCKDTSTEKTGAERTARVLTEWRQFPERCLGFRGQLFELPADLVADCVELIESRQARSLSGVCGSPEGMRTHVGHAGGLRGRTRRRKSRRCGDVASSASCNEAATDLPCSIELATRECPGTSDRITRPRVGR
jgi:hypothetical protein